MAADRGPAARLVYLDNLKWVLIAAIIASHAAMAYGAFGASFYVEPSLSPLGQAALSVLIAAGIMFADGLFFFVAGLLTPRSFTRKGSGKFLSDRLLRLGAPVLATVVVVAPAIEWLVSMTTGRPESLAAIAGRQLRMLEPGPMWFPEVLLIFTVCFVVWRRIRPARIPDGKPLQMRHLLIAAALIPALSFPIRLVLPMASIQPLDLHEWLWPQLAVLFALGVLAAERGWLDERPRALIRWASWLVPLAAIAVVVATIAASGSGPAPYLGGWHWQAVVLAGAEGVVAVGMSLALIDLFRQFGGWRSRLARALSRDSYPAFFLQIPVLTAIELSLSRLAWPGEAKLALVALAGVAISFALAWAVRRSLAATGGLHWVSRRSHSGPGRQLPHHPVG